MKVQSIFAISPVVFPQIETDIFGAGGSTTYEQSAPSERQKVEPSQYRLAPVSVSQNVHVIYLIAPSK